MTEQPTEPGQRQPTTLPLLGVTHKRHSCGTTLPICGTPATESSPENTTYTVVAAPELARYQDCIVCDDLWDDARVLGLTCSHCREKIRQ